MYQENLVISNKQELILLGAGRDQVTLDGSAGVTDQKPAILIEKSQKITVQGLQIVKSRRGVQADDTTGLVLADNSFKDNLRQGVFLQRAEATLTGNLIQKTQPDQDGAHGQGVNLVDSKVVIKENTISENARLGIWAQGSSTVTIQKNTLSDNGGSGSASESVAAIYLLTTTTGSPTATIEENTLNNNRDHGILLAGSAEATIANNGIMKTKPNVAGQPGHGIALVEKARATIRTNEINENARDGVDLFNEAQATLQKNTINSNANNAVVALDSSRLTMEENTITKNKGTGILTFGRTPRIRIIENTVTDNTRWGIWAEFAESVAECRGNTVTGNAGGNLSNTVQSKCS